MRSNLYFPVKTGEIQAIYRDGIGAQLGARSERSPDGFAAPGAIPTVDFLLHHLGAVVKKMAVKSNDWTTRSVMPAKAGIQYSVSAP